MRLLLVIIMYTPPLLPFLFLQLAISILSPDGKAGQTVTSLCIVQLYIDGKVYTLSVL